ncbi:MAG: porin family protein [Chlorobium sp.]|nr:MAG: porin family protein [Chlorobium sp.]
MKKKLSLPGVLLAAGMFAVPAHAESPYYVSGNIGASSFSKIKIETSSGALEGTAKTKAGIDLTGAIGRSFGDFRVEGEVGYQRNNSDTYTFPMGVFPLTGNFSVTSCLLNGYYDFKSCKLKPYLSAGVGIARVSLNKVPDPPVILRESHSAFGYQVGAGVAIPLSKTIDLDARYRYSGTTKVTLTDNHGKLGIHGSGFLLGLRMGI